ncbi:hypothetical protein MASR1M8_05840 [Thermomonas brevis]
MHVRKYAVAALLCGALGSTGEAAAETTGSLALTSNYLFRGISQSNDKPALQGGITWTHASGFYAGGWGSSISWLSDADPAVSSSVELDGFVGYGGSFGDSGVGFDVGANYYAYPGRYPAGFTSADTLELYAGVSWKALGAKYSHATTNLFGVPGSRGSGNLDLSANPELAPGLTLNAAVGKQWVRRHAALNYAFWKLGLTKSFGNGFSVAAAWNDTDIDGLGEAFTVSLAKSF